MSELTSADPYCTVTINLSNRKSGTGTVRNRSRSGNAPARKALVPKHRMNPPIQKATNPQNSMERELSKLTRLGKSPGMILKSTPMNKRSVPVRKPYRTLGKMLDLSRDKTDTIRKGTTTV